MKTFTAYVEWDPETKLYVRIIPIGAQIKDCSTAGVGG